MKTEKIEIVAITEVLATAQMHAEALGSRSKLANKVGVGRQEISQMFNGASTVPGKVLEFLGLEVRKVFVKRENGNG